MNTALFTVILGHFHNDLVNTIWQQTPQARGRGGTETPVPISSKHGPQRTPVLIQYKTKPSSLQAVIQLSSTEHIVPCIICIAWVSIYCALSPSRSPFKVSQPSLPSQFSLPLPITLRIAALAFPLHFSPTLSTCGP